MEQSTRTPSGYKLSSFVRLGLGQIVTSGVKTYPTTTEGANGHRHVCILIDEHNMNWSDGVAAPQDGWVSPNLCSIFLRKVEAFIREDKGSLPEMILGDALLSGYKELDVAAKKEQIAASAVSLCWLNTVLHVASVGICRAYLVQTKEIKQLTVDDCAYITENGTTYRLPNILVNSLGRGMIRTTDDIHLSSFDVQSQDLVILCNTTFYEHVTENDILTSDASLTDLDELCRTLGLKALQGADALDTVSVCMVRFE